MTQKKWLARVLGIASGTDKEADIAGIDPTGLIGSPVTRTFRTHVTNEVWYEVYCDGELVANHPDYRMAKSLYDNAVGVHKELYRREQDKVALILHKESYGVPIK